MDPNVLSGLAGLGGIALGAIILAIGLPPLSRYLDRREAKRRRR